jgi:hypothetical protein
MFPFPAGVFHAGPVWDGTFKWNTSRWTSNFGIPHTTGWVQIGGRSVIAYIGAFDGYSCHTADPKVLFNTALTGSATNIGSSAGVFTCTFYTQLSGSVIYTAHYKKAVEGGGAFQSNSWSKVDDDKFCLCWNREFDGAGSVPLIPSFVIA